MAREITKGWNGKVTALNENREGIILNHDGFYLIDSFHIYPADKIAKIVVRVYDSFESAEDQKASLNNVPFEYVIDNNIIVAEEGLFDKYFGEPVEGKEQDNAFALLSSLDGSEEWNNNKIPFTTFAVVTP